MEFLRFHLHSGGERNGEMNRSVFAKSIEFMCFTIISRGLKFCEHFDASSAHKLSSHELSLAGSRNYGCEGKRAALLESLGPADFAELLRER